MITHETPQAVVHHAVELAGRAPSIHNSQPWQFDVQTGHIDLYANYRRWLPATDADHRDLMLSCGAALHHLRVALSAEGIATAVRRMPADGQDLLATLTLRTGSRVDADLAKAITVRRTDRRAFRHWPVPEAFLTELADRAAEHGALLRVVEEQAHREMLVAAFREAAALQRQVAGVREELAEWTGTHRSHDGIPAANVPRVSTSGVQTGRFTNGELDATPGPEVDAATLAVIGTASDDQMSQLRAGEALSAVLLQATRGGLATCPLSQPLEVGATRRILRDAVLDGTLTPQIVIRVGWPPDGEQLPPVPRRNVADTLGRLPR